MRDRTFPTFRLALAGAVSLAAGACGGAGTADAAGGFQAMGQPTAVFPEDFGTIQTVRELPDGEVLVADGLGNALYLVDLDAGTRTVVGSEGEGPTEYRQPDAVWPLPDGETLLIDLGNGRTVTLGSDLSFGETAPIAMGDPRPGSSLVLTLPQGVDGQGLIYTRAMGGPRGPGGAPPDSSVILRVDRASQVVDTVARFKLQDMIRTESGGPNDRNVSIQPVPLSGEDAWGVAPDGSVVVARVDRYRIEWIHPDGSITSGPPTPHDPVSIGDAEKEEWLRESGRSGGGVGIAVMIENGAMQMSFSRGGLGGRRREIDNYTWPETKPPFYSGRIDVDSEGRAWVRRHVDAGAEATYDIFDRSGERVGTVTLPTNKRVLGFGAGTVYVVAYDEVDLNYLERYALPVL